MNVQYVVPKSKVFTATDIGVKESLNDVFFVSGDLLTSTTRLHPVLIFKSLTLLSGSPSIFMMVKTALWLATEHHFIVWFEFNGTDYYAHPHQDEGELLRLYHYTLCARTQQKMAERIAELESELEICYAGEDL